MQSDAVRSILIVGGGTAGWMAAAALSHRMPRDVAITLVESEAIGTVGVGEATIPPIVQFNKLAGVDEAAFLRETGATFKLGIEFADWLRPGHRYMHAFGLYGADMNEISFLQFWLRFVQSGGDPDLSRFSAETGAAYAGRFARHAGGGPRGPKLHHAFHFDAALYAAHLRALAESRGVARVEGRVVAAGRTEPRGFLEAVTLEDGRRFAADFFIDCSGFRGLLIEESLAAGYEEWSRWLPANRAVAIPCEREAPPEPYTRATAREAGWQWRIPLRHRTGNGYVFCDAFLGEDAAAGRLAAALDGPPLAEPRVLRFVTGRRRRSWIGNCVALGLASGFLEPLESTSIHLVHAGIEKLLALFPDRHCDPRLAARYDAHIDRLTTGIRDFLLAHYVLSERDEPFWRHCRSVALPDSLAERLALFRARGEVLADAGDLFKEVNWFAVLYGQGLVPQGHHPLADALSDAELATNLEQIRAIIADRVASLPPHHEFLRAAARG